MADREKDYSRQDQAVIARKERELEKTRVNAETAEDQVRKLLEKSLKDDATRRNVSRDCVDGLQGNKQSEAIARRRKGESFQEIFPDELVHGAEGTTDRSVTGYEKRYWEEDD